MEEWGALPGHGMANFTGDRWWLILGLIRENFTPAQRDDMLEHMPPRRAVMWESHRESSFAAMIRRGASDGMSSPRIGAESSNRYLKESATEGEGTDVVIEGIMRQMRRTATPPFPGPSPADQVAWARSELEAIVENTPAGRDDFEGHRTRRVYGLFAKTRSLDALAVHDVVLGVLDGVLGH